MTTLATTKTPQTTECRINYGDDWIEVMNLNSKVAKKLDVSKIDNNWNAFTGEEDALFNKLMGRLSPHSMTLNAYEMRLFLRCIEKVENPVVQGTPEVTKKGDVEVVSIESLSPLPETQRWQSENPNQANLSKQVPLDPNRPTLTYAGGTVTGLTNFPDRVTEASAIPPADTAPVRVIPTPTNPNLGNVLPQSPKTPPSKSRNERVQAAVTATANSGYVMFIYDIPQRLNGLNPSGRMWRHGFRANLSCWIMPAGQVSRIQDILQVFTENDISWHIVEYAESARAKIKEMAQEEIRKETARIHGSLIETIDSATKQFNEFQSAAQAALNDPQNMTDLATPKEMEKKARYRESRIRAAIKTAGENLNKAVESAILFDETESLDDLFRALRQAISARTEAFMNECATRARW